MKTISKNLLNQLGEYKVSFVVPELRREVMLFKFSEPECVVDFLLIFRVDLVKLNPNEEIPVIEEITAKSKNDIRFLSLPSENFKDFANFENDFVYCVKSAVQDFMHM